LTRDKNVSFVVWENVGMPVGIAGIEVGKNKGNKALRVIRGNYVQRGIL